MENLNRNLVLHPGFGDLIKIIVTIPNQKLPRAIHILFLLPVLLISEFTVPSQLTGFDMKITAK